MAVSSSDIPVVNPTDATVLFGAGVTCDAGGPTAYQLLIMIADLLVKSSRWREWVGRHIQPKGSLRFETAMDELAFTVDPDLNVLQFLTEMESGPLHAALARAALRGARLVTVNFDNLTESALAAEGLPPWTVDTQNARGMERSDEPGAVIKLHGTLRINEGRRKPEIQSKPLHATITKIVASGGGGGLPPQVDDCLHAAIDNRTLVVVGYSGSDDLDVMPSLAECRPSSVFWIQHDHKDTEPRITAASAASDSVANLLRHWKSRGTPVTFVTGSTIAVLQMAGWDVDVTLGSSDDEVTDDRWRHYVAEWARQHSYNDPSGLGWVAGLVGSLTLHSDAHDALVESLPSTADGLWTPQFREFRIAENEYLREVPRDDVRRLALHPAAVAEESKDEVVVASCQLLVARTFMNTSAPDLNAAALALSAAEEAIQQTTADGVAADIRLWGARLRLLQGEYEAAVKHASGVAETYRTVGDF